MSRVIDAYQFYELREDPAGMERYGIMPQQVRRGDLVCVHTVAFRTGKKGPWFAATADSTHMVTTARWELYQKVEEALV